MTTSPPIERPAQPPLGPPPQMLARAEDRLVKALIRSSLFDAGAPPVRIGRFAVLRLQGTGANGSVYATHDERLDRKVAVKLLRADDTADVHERMLREARALARLSHPNVVAVHEVGDFEGQVFIAMEFVEGPTLHAWLTRTRRSWREVCEVFVQAGRGLAAAHAAGLVHGDFKPANVLVGVDGRARVLDFGLVRGREDASAQRSRGDAGTPCYMAPEQFADRRGDARSDQFSFCVALHEGLYGRRPYTGATLPALVASMRHGELMRPPPGRRVPRWLRRLLLRGLRPDPADRWPSMDALLVELERRSLRSTGRWLGVVGALALAWTGVSPMNLDANACVEHGDPFAGVWDVQRQQHVEAALRASGSPLAEDAWLAVRRALDAYTAQWRAMRRDSCEATLRTRTQPAARMPPRATCLERRKHELAALVDQLTRAPVAPPALVERAAMAAMDLRPLAVCAGAAPASTEPEPPPALAAEVAALRRQILAAHTREVAGDYPMARTAATAAVAAARRLEYPPVLAEALHQRGRAEWALGDGDAAAATLEEAGALAEAAGHDELKVQVWALLVRVAVLGAGDPARGHTWFRLAQAAVARLGERGPLWAEALEGEGLAFYAESRFDRALAVQREVLAVREQALGPTHLRVADTLINLANALSARGDKQEALRSYERAVALRTSHLGPHHPQVSSALFDLALVHVDLGALDRGEALLARARAIDLAVFGPHSPRMAQIHMATALLHEQRGATVEALREAEAGVHLIAGLLPDEHREYAVALGTRGTLRLRLGDAAGALADYTKACAIWTRSGDRENAAMCASDSGEALLALGRPADALARFVASQRELAEIHAQDHEYLAYPLHGEGEALRALGRPHAAVAPLRRALAIREAVPGDPLELAATAWSLAQVLAGGTTHAEATALARRARDRLAALGPRGAARLAEIDRWLDGPRSLP